ncbi:MAG: hypothetical protein R3C05_13840 [Pirellulaceae bacterium]
MSVDQYSICPCGSGKKIKFCKCKESIHEMDRVLKMVGGGQLVAALDRLNQILDQHPDAAWCLAIKGRMLLNLDEVEALRQNAERFIRLQPSNPLALTQQAAYLGTRGETDKAAESLLQALAESSSGVDNFVLDVASVLALSFAQADSFLSARCFAGLVLSAKGYEKKDIAMSTVEQINQAAEISLLLKDLPTLGAAPKDPSLNERYNEAAWCFRANQFALAATKFDSLARTAPNEEAILRGQLVCAIWQANLQRQTELLRKLSDWKPCRLMIVPIGWRCRLCWNQGSRNAVQASNFVSNVEDIELVEQELLSSSQGRAISDDAIETLNREDFDVPVRFGFQVASRDIADVKTLDELCRGLKSPHVISSVFLSGKQTDRPAQLRALGVASVDRERFLTFVSSLTSSPGTGTRRH